MAAESPAPLVLEATIPLGKVSGRIDHMAVDLARRRLFVAEFGNDSLAVVDLAVGQVVRQVAGLKEPQGVVHVPVRDLVVVANGGDGSLDFFRAGDLLPVGRVELGSDADNLRLDSGTGRIFAGHGEGGLAVVEPTSRSKLLDIPLNAHPEGFQLAADGRRAFVNLPDARQIAVVDVAVGRQEAAWPLGGLGSNFPMAIERNGKRLAVAFRAPPTVALLDTENGQVIARQPSCGDADDLFFDERRLRIYLSCGEGALEVFASGDLRRIARIETAPGARTALFVPELDRLYVAARGGLPGGEARILVFHPAP